MKLTPAAKIQIVIDLLDDNIYDEEGNVVCKKEPLISKEEALKILGFINVQDK